MTSAKPVGFEDYVQRFGLTDDVFLAADEYRFYRKQFDEVEKRINEILTPDLGELDRVFGDLAGMAELAWKRVERAEAAIREANKELLVTLRPNGPKILLGLQRRGELDLK